MNSYVRGHGEGFLEGLAQAYNNTPAEHRRSLEVYIDAHLSFVAACDPELYQHYERRWRYLTYEER